MLIYIKSGPKLNANDETYFALSIMINEDKIWSNMQNLKAVSSAPVDGSSLPTSKQPVVSVKASDTSILKRGQSRSLTVAVEVSSQMPIMNMVVKGLVDLYTEICSIRLLSVGKNLPCVKTVFSCIFVKKFSNMN